MEIAGREAITLRLHNKHYSEIKNILKEEYDYSVCQNNKLLNGIIFLCFALRD